MEFTEVVKNRYSCKKYSDKPVPEDKLNAVLEAGRLAPTAKNLQEQRIYVLRSAEALAKVDACTPCRYGAGTVLAVAYDKDAVYSYPGGKYFSGTEDAAIVATHMILAAADAGLDSCWLNRFDPDELAAALAEYIRLFDRLMKGFLTGRFDSHEVEAAYYSHMTNAEVHI